MLTKDQRAQRRKGIGGSDVAALLGVSRYKSAVDLYLDKLGEPSGADIQEAKPQLERGNILEPLILKKYSKITGNEIVSKETIKHDKHEFLLANIDGYVPAENIIVEAKTSSVKKDWGDDIESIPIEYWSQSSHYSNIIKPKYVDIPVLLESSSALSYLADLVKLGKEPDIEIKIYRYYPDRDLEAQIEDKCIDFWHNYVKKQIFPPVRTFEDVKKKYNQIVTESHVIADSEICTKIANLHALREKIAEHEKLEDALKAQIADFLGNNGKMTDIAGNELAKWSIINSKRFDTQGFKREYPEIYERYLRDSKHNRLLIR